MSLKTALILTGVWTLLVIAGSAGAIWFVATQVPRHQQEARASMLGGSTAIVALIGYSGIWFPLAIAHGRKRRQQQAEEAARKKRASDKPTKSKKR